MQAGADGLARGQQRLVARHAWAAHNPAIEKTVEPSTAGVRRRIVLDRQAQAPGHPRAIVWLRLAAWDS